MAGGERPFVIFLFSAGENEVTMTLEVGHFVTVLDDGGTLCSGPGMMYDAIGSVEAGEILELVGRSDDSGWLGSVFRPLPK